MMKLLLALESRVTQARTEVEKIDTYTSYTPSIDKVDEVTWRNIFSFAVEKEIAGEDLFPDEGPACQHVPKILSQVTIIREQPR